MKVINICEWAFNNPTKPGCARYIAQINTLIREARANEPE